MVFSTIISILFVTGMKQENVTYQEGLLWASFLLQIPCSSPSYHSAHSFYKNLNLLQIFLTWQAGWSLVMTNWFGLLRKPLIINCVTSSNLKVFSGTNFIHCFPWRQRWWKINGVQWEKKRVGQLVHQLWGGDREHRRGTMGEEESWANLAIHCIFFK